MGFGICLAQPSPNEQSEIKILYARAVAGDKQAVVDCIARLENLSQREPANQVARVYLGSTYALRSRGLALGPGKLRMARRGLAVMDEAVAAAPTDVTVRLCRALTTHALPRFFGRAAESQRDFALLAERAKVEPEKFDADELRAVAEHAGTAP